MLFRKKLACEKIIATIKGLSIMNDDPSNVDVLYANITGEKFNFLLPNIQG